LTRISRTPGTCSRLRSISQPQAAQRTPSTSMVQLRRPSPAGALIVSSISGLSNGCQGRSGAGSTAPSLGRIAGIVLKR